MSNGPRLSALLAAAHSASEKHFEACRKLNEVREALLRAQYSGGSIRYVDYLEEEYSEQVTFVSLAERDAIAAWNEVERLAAVPRPALRLVGSSR